MCHFEKDNPGALTLARHVRFLSSATIWSAGFYATGIICFDRGLLLSPESFLGTFWGVNGALSGATETFGVLPES